MTNIAEILSNYPLGTQLYSPAFGRVRLKKIRPHLAVIVTDEQGEDWEMLYDGRFSLDGECILFPSKAERENSFEVNQRGSSNGLPYLWHNLSNL